MEGVLKVDVGGEVVVVEEVGVGEGCDGGVEWGEGGMEEWGYLGGGDGEVVRG